MKIKFTKLPTTDDIIKVSLDGGNSFKDYNVADIHESGIPLEDNQDYEKIQIQAPANILKNLNVVSSVKVEGGEGGESGVSYTFEVSVNSSLNYSTHSPRILKGVISMFQGSSLFQSSAV